MQYESTVGIDETETRIIVEATKKGDSLLTLDAFSEMLELEEVLKSEIWVNGNQKLPLSSVCY